MDSPLIPLFLTLSPSQVTPELMALFRPDEPAALRCQAVLENHAAGVIFTDHPETPTWGVVQEAAFGSLYLAGDIEVDSLSQLISSLRTRCDVLAGMREGDPRWLLFPPDPDYSGYTLEFTDRSVATDMPEVPDGFVLRRLDHSLAKQILDRNLLIRMFGTIHHALEWGYGLCLLHDGEVVCEAFAGPSAGGMIEIGVETNPHHMQKGYGFITCSHLIQAMEQQGFQTYWNCARQNLASVALARRLGYQSVSEYRLLAWYQNDAAPASPN